MAIILRTFRVEEVLTLLQGPNFGGWDSPSPVVTVESRA